MRKSFLRVSRYFVTGTVLLMLALPRPLRGADWCVGGTACCVYTVLEYHQCNSPGGSGWIYIVRCIQDYSSIQLRYPCTTYWCCLDSYDSVTGSGGQCCGMLVPVRRAGNSQALVEQSAYAQDCKGRYVLVRLPEPA